MSNSTVVHAQTFSGATWKKSIRSTGTGGNNCVEVARLPGVTGIRDTKLAASPILAISTADWSALIRSTQQ